MVVVVVASVVLMLLVVRLVVFAANENEYRDSLPEEIISIELDESNAFLLPVRDGYLLFDTGYPWDFDTFRSWRPG